MIAVNNVRMVNCVKVLHDVQKNEIRLAVLKST
jgi:hypothetical protein